MADEPTTLRNIGEDIGEGIGEVTNAVLDANLDLIFSSLGYIVLALLALGLVITIFEWLLIFMRWFYKNYRDKKE